MSDGRWPMADGRWALHLCDLRDNIRRFATHREGVGMLSDRVRGCTLVFLLSFIPAAAFAQQTGSIQGKVVDTSGAVLPGVTVEAKSNVLPSSRTTVSGSDGIYVLP